MSNFTIMSLADILAMPDLKWLVDGMIPEKDLTVLYGAPGSCKSFLALSLALHMAHGLEWRNQRFEKTATCYVAAEGVHGIKKRIQAWHLHMNLEPVTDHFCMVPQAVNIMDTDKLDELIKQLQARESELGIKFELITLDTLARMMVGANESAQEHMSIAVNNADYVARAMNCAVLLIHHSGKDESRRARGSSALEGGVASALKVSKQEKHIEVTFDKLKDGDDSGVYMFEKIKVDLGTDQYGKPLNSLVLIPMEEVDGEQVTRDQIDATCLATNMEPGKEYSYNAAIELAGMTHLKNGRFYQRIAETIVGPNGRTVTTKNGKKHIFSPALKKLQVEAVF